MPAARMPAAEVHLDAELVHELVSSQFPAWAALAVEALASPGWDNALFRLGDELLVRLPRRLMGAELVPKEHRWLPELAPLLPVPIPVPVGRGRPALGYPWPWSVCPWLVGDSAAQVPVTDPDGLADDLAAFLRELHQPGPVHGPRSQWRGMALAQRDDATRAYMSQLAGAVDVERAAAAWDEALTVPTWSSPDVWLHGDMHPANLLVRQGRLSAVLDFGDLVVGDPATDLTIAWMLLPAPARRRFRVGVGVDDDTWARGRGWAVTLGLAMVANSADNPLIAGVGHRALARALSSSA